MLMGQSITSPTSALYFALMEWAFPLLFARPAPEALLG